MTIKITPVKCQCELCDSEFTIGISDICTPCKEKFKTSTVFKWLMRKKFAYYVLMISPLSSLIMYFMGWDYSLIFDIALLYGMFFDNLVMRMMRIF